MGSEDGYLKEKHDPLIQEVGELVKIVATIIRNSQRNELPSLNPERLGFGAWDLGFGIFYEMGPLGIEPRTP